jgi:hypothetical protein
VTQVFIIAAAVLGVAVVMVGAYVVWLSVLSRARRPEEDGFEYVYVEDDGSAREVTEVERRRLSTEYEEGDSRRPYVKLRYESRDDEGRRRGFLRRRQLPAGVPIRGEEPE